MATVPVEREYQVAVQPLSPGRRSVPQASPEAFGAAEGRATQGLAQTVSATAQAAGDLALQMQQEDIERQLKKLDVATSQFQLQQLVGDEKNPGYLMQKGENALNGRKALDESLAKHQQELLAGVSDEKVKSMWSDVYVARRQKTDATINQHYQEQNEVSKDLVSKARIATAADEAAAGLVVPGAAVRTAADEAVSMADRAGLGPDAKKQFVAEHTTQVIKAAIVGEIKRGNLGKAQGLFKTYGEGMLGQEQALVQEMLQGNQDEEAAQSVADSAFAAGLPIDEAAVAIHAKYSVKVADAAVRRLATMHGLKDKAEADQKDADSAYFYGGMNHPEAPKSLDQLRLENPEAFARTTKDPVALNGLHAAEEARALGRVFARKSDGETFASIFKLPSEERARVNLEVARHTLTSTEYNSLVKTQAADVARLDVSSAEMSLMDADINKFAPKDAEGKPVLDAATMQAAYTAGTAWMLAEKAASRVPSATDVRKKAQELMLSVAADAPFYRVDLPKDGTLLVDTLTIEDLERLPDTALVMRLLRKANKKADPQTILEMVKAKLRNDSIEYKRLFDAAQ